jgi:hypothetical protein
MKTNNLTTAQIFAQVNRELHLARLARIPRGKK